MLVGDALAVACILYDGDGEVYGDCCWYNIGEFTDWC